MEWTGDGSTNNYSQKPTYSPTEAEGGDGDPECSIRRRQRHCKECTEWKAGPRERSEARIKSMNYKPEKRRWWGVTWSRFWGSYCPVESAAMEEIFRRRASWVVSRCCYRRVVSRPSLVPPTRMMTRSDSTKPWPRGHVVVHTHFHRPDAGGGLLTPLPRETVAEAASCTLLSVSWDRPTTV